MKSCVIVLEQGAEIRVKTGHGKEAQCLNAIDVALFTNEIVETCGYTDWSTFSRILEQTDLVYMDVKCIDPERHRRGTGVTNERILENAVKAAKMRPVRVRVPVIPGFNDDADELMAVAEFARKKMGVEEIELLKYNGLCESKYVRLERKYEKHSDSAAAGLEERMAYLRRLVGAVE